MQKGLPSFGFPAITKTTTMKTILGWVQSEAGLGRRVGVRAKASECVHFIMPTRPRARHGRGARAGHAPGW